ncbi:MAG: hypothetical protein U5Q03_12080 [Bacteroidota bacterium]|nr:hypothetical protein [Bacteroidota bacterium]
MKAKPYIIIVAMILDITVLAAFLWTKAKSDLLIVIVSLIMIGLIFTGEKLFLSKLRKSE